VKRYLCCDERRRNQVLASALNGIDFLEVLDLPSMPTAQRQKTLHVHFLKALAAGAIKTENVSLEGGERIREIGVTSAQRLGATGDDAQVLVVHLDDRGDFSPYAFVLTATAASPLDWLDPILSSVSFSFKVDCESDFDCAPRRVCPDDSTPPLEIDYLAKDYASFRRLVLDRLATTAPGWKERNPADVGVTLVELLAYLGDRLSYQQDAVATEAYLFTARRRVSVRRHVRLVDYFMHEGCNARVFLAFRVATDGVLLPKGTPALTWVKDTPSRLPPDSPLLQRALQQGAETFETMHDATLYTAHNRISFYEWGDSECCLPRGATRATLSGHLPSLRGSDDGRNDAGDVLIFEEIVGPESGQPGDADPAHRHAVRLTSVSAFRGADPLTDPVTGALVTEIAWAAEDALPFPLTLSSAAAASEVSVAWGNVVLADHGRTVVEYARPMDAPSTASWVAPTPSDELGPVPDRDARLAAPREATERCSPPDPDPGVARFRPRLRYRPVTHAATTTRTERLDDARRRLAFDPSAAAATVFEWDMRKVVPAVKLRDDLGGTWLPQRDLLSSDDGQRDFVVEVDDDGTPSLRFGDDANGQAPGPGRTFVATYRVGNGVRGNVGGAGTAPAEPPAEPPGSDGRRCTIAHVVSADTGMTGVRNAMGARGGIDPESVERVRQLAPNAFRVQERAVTPDDYAEVTMRHPQIQRAAATMRWTGSWHTMFLTIDRLGGLPVDAPFEGRIRNHVERYRMAGQDVEVDAPQFVALEVDLHVCVQADYFRSHVKQALLEVLGSTTTPDGRRGLFHPDRFTFGQPVYVSRLYSAAQAIEGVASVEVRRFQRLGQAPTDAAESGVLPLGRLEIARLDNDPSFPEHGVLRIDLAGGR
jgi:hypothetical protein